MKILFISENYYPNISGVPVVVKYLAEKLVEYGHDVGVLTREMQNAKGTERLNGVNIYRINVFYDLFKINRGNKKEFVAFIKEYDADVNIFECASCITSDIAFPFLKDIKGKKILHSHGFSRLLLKPFERMSTLKNTIGNTYNYFRWKGYFRYKLPKYLKDFDGVCCLSEADSSYLYLKKYFGEEVNILGNAADDIFFDEKIVNKIGNYTSLVNNKYFISIANYMAVKNQIGILEEFYKSNSEDFDMVFIGGEKNYYYDALIQKKQQFDEKYGKRNIHILTGVNRKDIPGILQEAYGYLIGSTAEGFSISLIESMAMGVPFISTNVGNARLLPGGIVIDDITEMHSAINSLILEKTRYYSCSQEAKKYARENCRIEVATNKLLDIIQKV